MEWLVKLANYRKNKDAVTGELPKLWDESRISIYEFLHDQPSGTDYGALSLPDEKPHDGTIRFAPGALDGAFGHHGGGGKENAQEIFSALQRACKTLTADNLKSLYDVLSDDGKALATADSLVSLIATYSASDISNLARIAFWLATQSPDREPVKFGIVLLGCLMHAEPPVEILTILGRHDEFTLYCAVALGKLLEGQARERALWQLAQQVHGWGRIQIVERLAETKDAEIKAWMLREGYKNTVMYEYLTYICATTGGLVEALRAKAPDEALLNGAGDILQSLIYGGPAEDIGDYADGVEAVRLFVGHAAQRPPTELTHLTTLAAIKRFVDDSDRDWTKLEANGWLPDVRKEIASAIGAVTTRPEWRPAVMQALNNSTDGRTFWIATQAAIAIGIDPWEHRFARQQADRNGDQWYFLMQTDDPARAARVVELAERQLDLSAIAQGPALEMGIGPGFADHSALDFILQNLGRFPALGWRLVATGLRSPVIRNRNMALQTLKGWPRETWPAPALPALEAALACEPDEKVKEYIRAVMMGKKVE